jgi:hypothetical protein
MHDLPVCPSFKPVKLQKCIIFMQVWHSSGNINAVTEGGPMTLATVRRNTERIREFSALPFVLVAAVSIAGAVFRSEPQAVTGGPISAGDVAWMLTATGLVLLMTPGLSFFYGGMVRSKNVVSTMLQSFVAMAVISILWIVVGFSLAFGDSLYGVIGDPRTFFMFTRVGAFTHPAFAPTIPLILFALFQLKFAIITPALITGSFAERVRFSSYLLFMCLFSIFIYSPLAHWTWHPDGFLHKLGVLDFAGGTVVHMSAGFAALAGAMVLGRRNAHRNGEAHTPANIPFVILGTGMLWFGWFGFNAGSAIVGVGPGRDGVRHHEYGVGVRGARVDLLRPDAGRETVGARRLRRRGRRARGDHTRRRLRQHRREHLHRHLRERRVEPDGALEETRRRSTTRSMSSRATASAAWSAC